MAKCNHFTSLPFKGLTVVNCTDNDSIMCLYSIYCNVQNACVGCHNVHGETSQDPPFLLYTYIYDTVNCIYTYSWTLLISYSILNQIVCTFWCRAFYGESVFIKPCKNNYTLNPRLCHLKMCLITRYSKWWLTGTSRPKTRFIDIYCNLWRNQ